jgi:D-amino-acid oxidase
VIGLSTAVILRQRGYRVKIYAAKITPQTTSDLAGAQWSPSFVSSGTTPSERARHNRILFNSYRKFEKLAGEKYGVHLRPNYLFEGFTDDLLSVPAGILKPIVKLAKFPFAGRARGGSVIQSWLIEPPIYIPALMNDLRELAVEIEIRELKSFDQFKNLNEPVIINCCGLGAATLVGDANLIPLKGQLLHLKPQSGLDYILLHSGYVFCRKDAIVVGGSFQKGIYDLTPDPTIAAKILENNRRFFA